MSKLELGKLIGRIGVIGSLAGLAGCGDLVVDDVGGISGSTANALKGVYELTHYTQSYAGCDAEGPSLLAASKDRQLVLASKIELGDRVVVVASCGTLEDCRAKARAINNNETYFTEYSFTLSIEIDSTRVGGFEASSGFWDGESKCIERTYSNHSLTMSAGALQLRSRTKLLADRPQADGTCEVTPDAASEAAALPCSEFTVLEGNRVADTF